MMVRVQSVIILLLFVWVAEEYNFNQFFQSWAAGILGVFGFLLGGTLAAVYAGILIVTYLGPTVAPANRQKAERREMGVNHEEPPEKSLEIKVS